MAVVSRPIPTAMPIAAVNQIPAAVVKPKTSSSSFLLMIVPAPKNPIPATMPCRTRVKSPLDRVTATNDAGSSSAESSQTAVVTDAPSGGVPPGFASVFTEPGCGGCSVTAITNGLQATIAGAADSSDTAYGVQELGGAGGLTGRVFVRSLLSLAQGQTLSGNLAVLQIRNASGQLVYELSPRLRSQPAPVEPGRRPALDGDHRLDGSVCPQRRHLFDSSRGLRARQTAPSSCASTVSIGSRSRVSAGGTTGNQRFLRAGIDHYDGSSGQPVAVRHTYVATSQTAWLGAPGGGPPAPPPANQSPPTISGTAQVGQTLSASTVRDRPDDRLDRSRHRAIRDGAADSSAREVRRRSCRRRCRSGGVSIGLSSEV